MSEQAPPPESLLPYDRWTEEAMQNVALRALEFAAKNGLPGEHHFYLTFRTDHPETKVPGHLKARYPQEMTIVLQHQFWDLNVDRVEQKVSVGLSFGGIAASLVIPFAALVAFWDPHVRVGLRFGDVAIPDAEAEADAEEAKDPVDAESASLPPEPSAPRSDTPAQVVSLDAFRRRPTRE
ncbi:SspB family protein [Roseomonas xinghualingensis]|uniref:SspB family protein n=1 Tax=Roseomonas xinghualingensis TaxID=2986475 RepID=UPI0021F15D8F|nr:ClpXP protease specificity-enhancing factor SspB [Roseomonas sp. SXEYE001]MCV4207416.1 ClpXP protease specificity-enhancing factor SspB [Roseomonas sp. SXEYE001]